jgi:hypothetical protein
MEIKKKLAIVAIPGLLAVAAGSVAAHASELSGDVIVAAGTESTGHDQDMQNEQVAAGQADQKDAEQADQKDAEQADQKDAEQADQKDAEQADQKDAEHADQEDQGQADQQDQAQNDQAQNGHQDPDGQNVDHQSDSQE